MTLNTGAFIVNPPTVSPLPVKWSLQQERKEGGEVEEGITTPNQREQQLASQTKLDRLRHTLTLSQICPYKLCRGKEPPPTCTHSATWSLLLNSNKDKSGLWRATRPRCPPTTPLLIHLDPIQSPSPFFLANLHAVQISNTSIPTLIRFSLANCASLPLLLSLHLSTPFLFGYGRTLFGNKIKSVAKKAFSGLETLEHLWVSHNAWLLLLPAREREYEEERVK